MGTGDYTCHSKNTPWIWFMLLGGNWHNNHHAVPSSASNWVRWWEIDLSYVAMMIMEATGMIWNVRVDPNDYDPDATYEEETEEVLWMAVQLVGLTAFIVWYVRLKKRPDPYAQQEPYIEEKGMRVAPDGKTHLGVELPLVHNAPASAAICDETSSPSAAASREKENDRKRLLDTAERCDSTPA